MSVINVGDAVSYKPKDSSSIEFGCVTSVRGNTIKMKVDGHRHHEISGKRQYFSKVEKIFG